MNQGHKAINRLFPSEYHAGSGNALIISILGIEWRHDSFAGGSRHVEPSDTPSISKKYRWNGFDVLGISACPRQ
jgi:hypothetical protein